MPVSPEVSDVTQVQKRIQDFRGRQIHRGEAQTYYLAYFLPKTAWKWKKTGLDNVRASRPHI